LANAPLWPLRAGGLENRAGRPGWRNRIEQDSSVIHFLYI
jgi:hypothetical protein